MRPVGEARPGGSDGNETTPELSLESGRSEPLGCPCSLVAFARRNGIGLLSRPAPRKSRYDTQLGNDIRASATLEIQPRHSPLTAASLSKSLRRVRHDFRHPTARPGQPTADTGDRLLGSRDSNE